MILLCKFSSDVRKPECARIAVAYFKCFRLFGVDLSMTELCDVARSSSCALLDVSSHDWPRAVRFAARACSKERMFLITPILRTSARNDWYIDRGSTRFREWRCQRVKLSTCSQSNNHSSDTFEYLEHNAGWVPMSVGESMFLKLDESVFVPLALDLDTNGGHSLSFSRVFRLVLRSFLSLSWMLE